jgi:hypothetical protein
VSISSSVVTIANDAFSYCENLTNIGFAASSSLEVIGERAFCVSTKLASVTIPASVVTIDKAAFVGCQNLSELTFAAPSSLEAIGESAFYDCFRSSSSAKPVAIPASVATIGTSAFCGCIKLDTLTFAAPSLLKAIGEATFSGCSSLTLLTIPASVRAIGRRAFAGCEKLANLDVASPSLLESIGESAFDYCNALTSLTIPASVKVISDYAFLSCQKLSSISVDPASAVYASEDGMLLDKQKARILFCPPEKTASVTLPASVRVINGRVFSRCSTLTGTLTIPASTSFDGSAFCYCKFTSVVSCSLIPPAINSAPSSFAEPKNMSLTVPTSAVAAYQNATGWKEFGSVKGGGVLLHVGTSGGGRVEGAAYGLYPAGEAVKLTATAPAGGAFLGWQVTSTATGVATAELIKANSLSFTLTRDTLLTAVFTKTLSVGVSAGKLSDVEDIISAAHLTLTGTIDARDVRFMRDNMPLLQELDLSGVTIAAYEGGDGTGNPTSYPANEMPERSFYQNTTLASVTLPSSITSIGAEAFKACSGLTGALTIPAGVTSIGNSAFESSGLTRLAILEGVETIGNYAFSGCYRLTGTLALPASVTSIGEYAFADCGELTGGLTIPAGVTSISRGAFRYCIKLTSVTIPSGVETIGIDAFYGCRGLAGPLIIPAGVTSIGANAFRNCSGLTALTLPASV